MTSPHITPRNYAITVQYKSRREIHMSRHEATHTKCGTDSTLAKVEFDTVGYRQLVSELCNALDELEIPVKQAVIMTDMPQGVEIKVIQFVVTKEGKEVGFGVVLPRTMSVRQKKDIVATFKENLSQPLTPKKAVANIIKPVTSI